MGHIINHEESDAYYGGIIVHWKYNYFRNRLNFVEWEDMQISDISDT